MGAAPASFRLFWFEVLPIFAARYPGIEVSTSAESVEEISALLQSGDLDFAIGSLEALRGHGEMQIEDNASLAVSPIVRRGHTLVRARKTGMTGQRVSVRDYFGGRRTL